MLAKSLRLCSLRAVCLCALVVSLLLSSEGGAEHIWLYAMISSIL